MTKQPPKEDDESPSSTPDGFVLDIVMGGAGTTSEVVYRPLPPRSAFINLPAGKAGKVKGRQRRRPQK